MKHRGRHRRRRRGRALRATLAGTALALTAAATMISTSQATDADDPGALKPLTTAADTAPLRLTEHAVPGSELDRLTASMGPAVGVGAVLADPDGALEDADDCGDDDRRALPVEPAVTTAYCWPQRDTDGWRAGAVTTSGDADEDGRWGAHRVILSGWTRGSGTPAGQGLARIAFVAADDDGTPRYTWALLAVPVDGGRDFRGLGSDVSGMVWYQDKLLVTAGRGEGGALYVYDLDLVQRATVDAGTVGRVPGGWSAAGARYVLPAVASYATAGADAPRPGGIALDRTTVPESLVVHEATAPDEEGPTRLWRYALGPRPGYGPLLRTEPVAVYETELTQVRGVLAHRSDWYVSRATGAPEERGTLWRQDTKGASPVRCGADETYRCWSGPATSLSYWQATGDVWSQSGRMLFALPLAAVDEALER
ncbi:hypothetical protein [Streptomyces sp. PAM3C]|uniref:hypothetical protein n=1 Tax=Streptomyces sp. PAM3C TaxID=2847300 RepID=UPI001C1DE90A|nr:hypothetical protein [Streptomyces sp. PAM3C]MBU5946244.1 hypothetical protein [Streptomyces sp. PAM3C]